ncbi:MAG: prefoldin subunit alpha [Candidatus Woesearchaeota archaeon]|jgi:prefoldin alpha subunit
MTTINTESERNIQLQTFVSQLQQITKYLSDIKAQEDQMIIVVEALKEFKHVKKDTKILAPIAQGIYLNAKVTDTEEIIVNSGAGIATKRTIDKTIVDLETELEHLRKHVEEVVKQKAQITQFVQILQTKET